MQDSIWFRTLPRELRDSLQQSEELPEEAEVVIVGAGIVGLMTAYYLTEAGVGDIWVLDRGTVLGEASGSNAGGLWFAQQSPEMGPLASLVSKTAELYEELSERFDFDLRKPGMLQLFFTAKEAAGRAALVKAVKKAGFRAESVSSKQIGELEPTLGRNAKGAVYYPDEGRLHPARLAGNLARYLREKEVRFSLGVPVESLQPQIETAQGAVSAGATVITTGAWTPLLTEPLGWKPPIKPMRGTLLAIEPMRQTIRHTLMTPNYYYWQLTEGHIAGGRIGRRRRLPARSGGRDGLFDPQGDERVDPLGGAARRGLQVVRLPPFLQGLQTRDRSGAGSGQHVCGRRTFQEGHHDGPGYRQDPRGSGDRGEDKTTDPLLQPRPFPPQEIACRPHQPNNPGPAAENHEPRERFATISACPAGNHSARRPPTRAKQFSESAINACRTLLG